MRTIVPAVVCGCLLTSAGLMAQAPPEYLDVIRVQVRGDKIKEYEDLIKKLIDVNRKYKGDRWIALQTEYGDFGGYTFSSSRQNLAAVETGMNAFQKALKEGLGPLGDKLMHDLSAYSASGHSEIRHRRWDLSVNTPANNADMLDAIAKTRWIRTLTLRMKPGHNLEYIAAWKDFQTELQKVTPAVPTFVSESSTGPSSIFVGIYYKSWDEMDASASGVQKALDTNAYRSLMQVTQNAVQSSLWEIHRIRPDLSYPPDEVVAADPVFWKPKAPAAPKPAAAPAAPAKK